MTKYWISVRDWSGIVLLLLVATAVGFLMDPFVTLTSQVMIYMLAVVIAAYKMDWVKSSICAVGGALALSFFFVPPRWSFEVEHQEHFIALVTMLVVALVISRLSDALRHKTEVARLNEQYARQLQNLAADLSDAATTLEVLALGRAALDEAFAGPNVLALAHDINERNISGELPASVRDGMRYCMTEGAALGPGTSRWPGLEDLYLPLGRKGHVFGAACIRPALVTDETGQEHAQALCALLTQALRRLSLTQSMQEAQGEARRQQLQNTFLAAISHDLRTPLASIVGAASSLQTQHEKLSLDEQWRLLDSIVREASYLSVVTENTLQLVRLASPGQILQRNWESIEEIVGSVLARMRQSDHSHRIKPQIPGGLPLVKADPVLLAQLLVNLLDNALKYSDGPIDLIVESGHREIEIYFKDLGPGISEIEQENIFRPFVRGDNSGRRGAGLGLALCRAIAQAHGGQLTIRPRAGAGSNFCLTLPLEEHQPVMESP